MKRCDVYDFHCLIFKNICQFCIAHFSKLFMFLCDDKSIFVMPVEAFTSFSGQAFDGHLSLTRQATILLILLQLFTSNCQHSNGLVASFYNRSAAGRIHVEASLPVHNRSRTQPTFDSILIRIPICLSESRVHYYFISIQLFVFVKYRIN